MKKPVYVSKGFGFFVLSVIFLWAVCGWILLSHRSSTPTCNESYRKDKVVSISGQLLQSQTAKTPQQQEKGLGGRACIGPDRAMLFIFDNVGYHRFWMNDMKFSIDIIWISANKRVVYIQKDVTPSTYPATFVSTTPAKDVLEVGAGQSDVLGIKTGTQLSY